MELTRYFQEQVLLKRPYLQIEWCLRVISSPDHVEVQSDNRIRHWGWIEESGKFLRVVTLDDGVTIHNAFFDRNFVLPGIAADSDQEK